MIQEQKIKETELLKEKYEKNFYDYKRLIDIVGMNFFVKYYCKIRDLSIADLIDVIDENYPFEEKKSRIKSAKEIFKLRIEQFTLEQISDIKNEAINIEIKNQAIKILKNEFNSDNLYA